MSNKKQNHIVEANKMVTAVEWLAEQMMHPQIFNPFIEQAKAMEKEQMLDIWSDGNDYSSIQKEEFEQYYKETYE